MKRYPGSLPFPFARAVEANGFLFLSGQVSMNAQGDPYAASQKNRRESSPASWHSGLMLKLK